MGAWVARCGGFGIAHRDDPVSARHGARLTWCPEGEATPAEEADMTRHPHQLEVPQGELEFRNRARLLVASVLLILFSSLAMIAPAELADPGMTVRHFVAADPHAAE
jgi:hypothetical protein